MAIDSLNFNNYSLLSKLTTTGNVQDTATADAAGGAVSTSFSDFLKDALTDTVSSDYDSKAAGIDMLLGGDTDLHNITIAEQKSEILLNLTVQVRNKMVESYQEIMRMQV